MKLPLIFALLLSLTIGLQEQTASQEPDLIVTKFNWTKRQQDKHFVYGATEGLLPSRVPNPREPRGPVERKMDNETAEAIARNAPVKQLPDYYSLHLELKNAGPKAISSFVWEYRPTGARPDYEPTQYVCAVDAKPDEIKKFDLLTPFAPVKLVSASEKKPGAKDGTVVINQIEYSDRSLWKRKGWSILVPPEMTRTLSVGKCFAF